MKRQKEIMASGMSLAPVRLLGGFVCADHHVGCSGCSFCLNRRDPALREVLDRGIHLGLGEVGVTPEDLVRLARATKSFSRARLGVRMGHLTDWRYQAEATEAFYNAIPEDHPFVAMTRYPLNERQRALDSGRPNLLIHITVAPPIPGLEKDCVDARAVIESARGVDPESIVFMCRPLVEGNGRANLDTIKLLPPGAAVAAKGISTHDIPGMGGIERPPPGEFAELRKAARDRGLRVLDYFGCSLWRRLGRPFFKYADARRAQDSACAGCENEGVCAQALEPADPSELMAKAEALGLEPESAETSPGKARVAAGVPGSRAEEVYLSELFGADVSISSVARSDAPGVRELESRVFQRWADTGFAPVAELEAISDRVKKALAERDRPVRA